MLTTKTRTTIAVTVASASFAFAAALPAASQAQWHTYCTAGHCITHQNFASGGLGPGGSNPCAGISSGYSKAYEGLLDAIQNKKEQADKVHPEMTQAEAQANIEEAEAAVHSAELEAFEWGCSIAAQAPATASLNAAPVAAAHA